MRIDPGGGGGEEITEDSKGLGSCLKVKVYISPCHEYVVEGAKEVICLLPCLETLLLHPLPQFLFLLKH